ncbi:hypothetical protein [Labrys wisconsinensis]|uniref:GlsB/YeaQ/YmgE family stress response membrane protein n=1 Tax=Labrys wisconsinensis TaxID=425677 RepID=A0ABU0JGN0_9HYPH|nr:hypothetical protein [Labrys wisconsinensis]MDQ0473451.1 hypothetical protein [Labrys wisconsinensis]
MDSSCIPGLGAAGFGCIIGWLVYYINRYRKADVQFSDLTTIVGIVGGAGVTSLFGGADKALFGAYGIGLFVGFFGYFIALIVLVHNSGGVFGATWFLDGRRKKPAADEEIQGTPPSGDRPPMDIDLGGRLAALEGRQAALEQVAATNPRTK